MSIADSHEVEVPCTHPKTSKDALERASVFLPHMMFYTIGENYPVLFHELFSFGKGVPKVFWDGVRKTGDEKLVNHPMSLEKDWDNLCLPLFVHGDGVEFSNNDNLMVFSWGPLGSNLSTMLKHWLLACFPKSCGSKKTWEVIWKWLHWSFTALAAGRHPSVGPDNEPLEKGSMLQKLAGKPLHHKRYKGILWSVIGDHEFFSTPWVCPIGAARLHAGSVTPKIVFHVPLEKGTKKSVWKSRGSQSSAMQHHLQTPCPAMLCSNCLG